MPVVSSICPVTNCGFNKSPVFAEIAHTKRHIKSHDYRILLETAFNLGIISSPNERRSVNWLVDELFEVGRHLAGVALS